jgi:hypothetical protein
MRVGQFIKKMTKAGKKAKKCDVSVIFFNFTELISNSWNFRVIGVVTRRAEPDGGGSGLFQRDLPTLSLKTLMRQRSFSPSAPCRFPPLIMTCPWYMHALGEGRAKCLLVLIG